MMELVFPTLECKQAVWDYRQEHVDCGEAHIHGSSSFSKADSYEMLTSLARFICSRVTPGISTTPSAF